MIAGGIDYLERGSGPPVICLHGIGGNADSFRPQLDGLDGLRLIAWNMPGYGASPRRPLSFAALSEALSDFMAALDLEAVHLMGHSIGGMIAIEHAARRPEQVRSLALLGTTPSFGGRDEDFKRTFLKVRLAPLDAGQTMADLAAATAPQIVGSIADDACVSAVEAAMAGIGEATWRDVLECLVTFDRRADIAHIPQPACMVAGSEDRNAPARTMRKMAARMPDAQFHEIMGAGHMINQEAPDRVNTILRTFYGSLNR